MPGLSIAIHSNIDPTYCPEGKSVLSSVFLADIEPFKDLLDSDGTRGERYFELKEKIAENVIQKASNYLGIPDLANHVEIFDVATPLTLQRYTNNKNGAFIGWKVIPEQQIENQISPETPIKNLYLASAWTLYGAGISGVMMNGEEVAKKILKKVK
jgi:phytoene dehydrogenase-like protein